MTDKQQETYPISNVGECPFCHKNSNYVERMTLDSCAVICDCGAQGPSSCPESDEDNEIEDENDLDPGYLAAVRLWKTQQASRAEPVGEWVKAEGGDYPQLQWRIGYRAEIGDKLYTAPQPPKAVPDIHVDFGELRRALGFFGIAQPESNEELGERALSYMRRVIKKSAEADAFGLYITDHPGASSTACDDQEAPDDE